MIADGGGNSRPAFNLRHYSPKAKRPNSSPNCLASSGSLALRKRSASSKNAFSFCFRASIPSSMSSTRTRLSLKRWLLAMRSTCLAMGVGSDTLRRTCFVAGIASLYTTLVHSWASARNGATPSRGSAGRLRDTADVDLPLSQARSCDIVCRLHAHERVHFHAEGFFDAQGHVPGGRCFSIHQHRTPRPGNPYD